MSWAEVKKINSNFFKPINTLIDELSQLVLNIEQYSASDDVLLTLNDYDGMIYGTKQIANFSTYLDGTLRISCTGYPCYDHSIRLTIKENGTQISEVFSNEANTIATIYTDVPIKRGATYQVFVYGHTADGAYLENVLLKGKVIKKGIRDYKIYSIT